MITIQHEKPNDAYAREALLDRAWLNGAARHGRYGAEMEGVDLEGATL